MPHRVVNKAEALNNHERAIKNSRILILGIAYKRDIDDVRESPSIEIIELLHKKGAYVDYSDPYVPIFPSMSPSF
jgi:UDP-N-acetyl-D-glucosamine dehydrogenase